MTEQKPKRKVSAALVALTLILAILVTGFGAPGFLLGLLERKTETKLSSELTAVPHHTEQQGNSREVHLEPLDYLTIDAPRDAFYENTDIVFEPMDDEEIDGYEATLQEFEPNQVVLAAYHIDAGLEPDDVMPGSYTVTIDLDRAGIPEDLWPCLTAYRVDDDGAWMEYAVQFDGSNMLIEANQNSALLIAGGIIYTAYLVVDEITPTVAAVGVRRFFSIEDYIYVYDNDNWRTGKKIFKLKFTYDDTIGTMLERKKDLELQTTVEPLEVKQAYSREFGVETEDPSKINAIDYPAFKLYFQNYKQVKLNQNAEYVSLCEQLKTAAEQSNYRPEILVKTAERLRWAYAYLKDVVKVNMPKYVMDVKLASNVGGGTAAGVTVNHVLFKNSYLAIATGFLVNNDASSWDKCLLTATHEIYHGCQRTYCSRLYSLKVEEAVAQMVEEDARKYFKDNGKISTWPACENASYLEYYALPLNDYSVSYPEGSKSCSGSEKSDAGYPLAHFIRFLKDKTSGVTYDTLCRTYKKFWTTPSVTEYLCEAFGLSEEALTAQYTLFARQKQAMFYERAKALYATDSSKRWAFPSMSGVDDTLNGYKVEVSNKKYTIRTRHLFAHVTDGYTGDVCMLLVPADDFAENLPDFKIYGVGPHQSKQVKYGLFFDKAHYLDEYYVIEVDGGTDSGSKSSSYAVWTLEAPEIEENPEVKDRLLKFDLPEKSDVAEAGCIDGYRVTIKCSDGTETVKHYKISGAGKTISLKVKNLAASGTREEELDDLSFNLTVCEYIKERDGSRTYGPESDSRRSLESAMNETLAEMGAGDGVITISLGWQSPDDLDLHVLTPSGNEIYYGDKETGGGILDVDMQVSEIVANPAEHVTFPDPDPGEYKVWVHNYYDRTEDSDTPFLVVIKVGNESRSYHLTAGGGSTQVATFTYGRPEGEETGQEYQD